MYYKERINGVARRVNASGGGFDSIFQSPSIRKEGPMTYTWPLLADVEKTMQVANGQMQKGCGGRRGSA
jgi:hypothetical protein